MASSSQQDLTPSRAIRWPSVVGPLNTDTRQWLQRSVLSDEPPTIVPIAVPPLWIRHLLEQRISYSRELLHQAEERAEERLRRREQRLADRDADAAFAKLQAHRDKHFAAFTGPFVREYRRWTIDVAISEADVQELQAFQQHVENAKVASRGVEVRFWDMLYFFDVFDEHPALHAAIKGMIKYSHRAAILLHAHHKTEMRARGFGHDHCLPEDGCSAEIQFAAKEGRYFGFDAGVHENGFEEWMGPISSTECVKVLGANFEVRKVRLQHAAASERYGFYGIGTSYWIASLDRQMVAFLDAAAAAVVVGSVLKNGAKDRQLLSATNDSSQRAAILSTIHTDTAGLFTQMIGYRQAIEDRKLMIDTLRGRLLNLNNACIGDKNALTMEQLMDADDDMDVLRETMAEGMNINEGDVVLPFPALEKAYCRVVLQEEEVPNQGEAWDRIRASVLGTEGARQAYGRADEGEAEAGDNEAGEEVDQENEPPGAGY